MRSALRGFDAFFRREFSAGKANRSLIVFPLVLLAAGLTPAFSGNVAETAELYLLQALLYLLPLFAIIVGTSAAQADSAENLLLGSLPVSRTARVTGKFTALFLLVGVAQAGLFVPSLIAGVQVSSVLALWGYGLGIGAVFLALGLLLGFRTDDGVRAHLFALGVWLLVTFGFGVGAWLLTASGWAQRFPGTWLFFLGSSPLEALRVGVLFSVEAVPFARDTLPGPGRLWLEYPGAWFTIVALVWTGVALLLCRPRTN